MALELSSSLNDVKGVGNSVGKKLNSLGLATVGDLLEYFPRKYEDYSKIQKINQLKPGKVTIEANIKQAKGKYVRGGLHITEAVASDETGSLKLVWFNQPYRKTSIKNDETYYVSGMFEFKSGRFAINNPNIEPKSNFLANTARILPIYRETKGFSSKQIRNVLKQIYISKLDIPETLPEEMVQKYKILSRSKAIHAIHFPNKSTEVDQAITRLSFEELFELILAAQLIKRDLNKSTGIVLKFNETILKDFVGQLPFKLTKSQRAVAWQIIKDMESGKIMNRLLEGDVGSGKTVVAIMAALVALSNGHQVALMAPTELLARQHAESITKLLEKTRFYKSVVLLVAGLTAKNRREVEDSLANKEPKLLVGTQALIQEKVNLENLALVIVDEQHRFGVRQRQKLLAKTGEMPHMLSMTATPIPRSLALTVFGELDISLLTDKPHNRKETITETIHAYDRHKLYANIEKKIRGGNQMFVVCPIIEESSFLKVKSAQIVHGELTKVFPKFNIGLMHGRQNSKYNQEIMEQFVKGKINILVATTMIEVGVDVPNANIIMIESPERFGLAQLHQLRGRVGRDGRQGYCYLMLNEDNSAAHRLNAIKSTNDGFKLAEYDLKMRGAGALYGHLQHGKLDLKIANFTDARLISDAREAAKEFMKNPENMIKYTHIDQRIKKLQTIVHLN